MKSYRQKQARLLTPVPNGNQPGPGLALTHVSILPDKAPGEETHSQSCRGEKKNHHNNPKPEGFSLLNTEQSQAPSPCKIPLAGTIPSFPALGRSASRAEAQHEPEHQQTAAQRKIPSPIACPLPARLCSASPPRIPTTPESSAPSHQLAPRGSPL